ncbi:MAG: carbohydrate binding family 9 domain-containing protein [Gemmatimonadota bacterium]|nr:carbohydrate binding family 9 domain-containing protein [Gemmatimonadota bacterium]
MNPLNRLAIVLIVVYAQPLSGQGDSARSHAGTSRATPVVSATSLTGSIQLDGKLDEPAWASASPVTSFTQIDPVEGAPASEKTEVRVLVGPDALYIGARLYESNPANIRPRLSRRDEPVDGDVFAVTLDSRHDHLTGYYFRVTAGGAMRDAVAGGPNGLDLSWDAVWDAAVFTDASGWSTEIRIPFSQLPYNRGDRVWGIQFERYRWNKQEQDFFAFTPKKEVGGVARYGHLVGLGELPAPSRVELTPYVSTRAEYLEIPAGNPFRDGKDYFASTGVDLKYRLTSSMTVSATVNPDFGQVEVDPAVVNLTAFETFFPEKRPFFVEGRELFRFGDLRTFNSYGSPTFFFSRRIGRQPHRQIGGPDVVFVDAPQQTTIATAAKLTGKTRGGWSTGILDAVTTSETANFTDPSRARLRGEVEPLSNYFVGRLRREMRQGNTVVGSLLTAVNRDLHDPALRNLLRSSAYVGGLDLNHSWKNRDWAFDASLAGSQVRGLSNVIAATQQSSARYFQRPDARSFHFDPNRTSLSGYAGQAALIKSGGLHWGGNLAYQFATPGLEVNDLGFQSQADRRAVSTDLYYQENKPGRFLRSWIVTGFTNQAWNYDGDIVFNNYASFAQGTFNNFAGLFMRADYSGEGFDDRLTRGGPVARQPRSIVTDINYFTDRRKVYSGSIEWYRSADVKGQLAQSYSLQLAVQPKPGVRFSLEPNLQKAHSVAQYVTTASDPLAKRTYDNRYVFATIDQTTLALVTRADWTFTPKASLQIYLQPLISAGDYTSFKELRAPRSFDFDIYGRDVGTISKTGGVYTIDPDGNAATANSIQVPDPNFNFRSLRGNAVMRWEYRPGSALFFVWQQQRVGSEAFGDFDFSRDFHGLVRQHPDNVFTIKATYYLAY